MEKKSSWIAEKKSFKSIAASEKKRNIFLKKLPWANEVLMTTFINRESPAFPSDILSISVNRCSFQSAVRNAEGGWIRLDHQET